MSCYYGNKKIGEIDINVHPRYWKNVYENFTLPMMTSPTTPVGQVNENWNKVNSTSTDIYKLFWDSTYMAKLSCYGNAGDRYVEYRFAHYLEANVTYKMQILMYRQRSVSITAGYWYYRTPSGDTPIFSTDNIAVNDTEYNWGVPTFLIEFTPPEPVVSIFWDGVCNASSSYIYLFIGNLRLFRADGKPLRYLLGSVESNASNYDYKTIEKTPIHRIYKGSTLVYGLRPGQKIFESATPGTTTFNIPSSGLYQIIAVGGGGGSGGARAGAGAYFNGYVYLTKGACTITVGAGGTASGGYCRNNNGGTGGNTSVTQGSAVSIVCPGGRYSCGRRNGCGAGPSYAPTYSISPQHTVLAVSENVTRGDSWYNGWGAGAYSCDCDECAGKVGTVGYVAIIGV